MGRFCENCERKNTEKCPINMQKSGALNIKKTDRKTLRKDSILDNKYQIYDVIGMGGLAVTYCACSKLRSVAIKQFNPRATEKIPEKVLLNNEKGFLKEAYRMVDLKHPNIVSVYDIIDERKDSFVMELLQGRTLKEEVENHGIFTIEDTLSMLDPIFEATAYVHSCGFIHRDIKPANIMVCNDGVIKLLDFGITCEMDSDDVNNYATSGYAAPEMYMNSTHQGRWTDVYALAAVIYYMITGEKIPDSRERVKSDRLEMPGHLTDQQKAALKRGLEIDYRKRHLDVMGFRAELIAANDKTFLGFIRKMFTGFAKQTGKVYTGEGYTDWTESTQLMYQVSERDGEDTEFVHKSMKKQKNEPKQDGEATEFIPKQEVKRDSQATEFIPKQEIKRDSQATEFIPKQEVKRDSQATEFIPKQQAKQESKTAESARHKQTQHVESEKRASQTKTTAQNAMPKIGEILTRDTVAGMMKAGQTEFVVPNGVKIIGGSAFRGCSNLTSIIIPDEVNSISSFAFKDCSGLKKIRIPDGIKAILEFTFDGCKSIENIDIPNGVETIEQYAFRNCQSLKSIDIPSGVERIGDMAFGNCYGLKKIRFGEVKKLPRISNFAFDNVTATIYYHASNNNIFWVGENYGGNLTWVSYGEEYDKNTMPKVGEILTKAYAESVTHYSTINFTIPNGVKDIGRSAFRGHSRLKTIVIPNSVTSIGSNAFRDCSSLTSVNMSDGVKDIRFAAFYGCRSLAVVNMSDNVKNIGDFAFFGCSHLKSIEIPSKVEKIGKSAFWGCSKLKKITFERKDIIPQIDSRAFEGVTAKVYYHAFNKYFPWVGENYGGNLTWIAYN